MENKDEFHTPSFIKGLESAIEQIETEYDMCVLELGDHTDNVEIKKRLNYIKMAFCRATSLIEDEMIQYGAKFTKNLYVDKIFNLEDKPNWHVSKKVIDSNQKMYSVFRMTSNGQGGYDLSETFNDFNPTENKNTAEEYCNLLNKDKTDSWHYFQVFEINEKEQAISPSSGEVIIK